MLEGWALTVLAAAVDLDRGDPDEAVARAAQALVIQSATGHRLGQAYSRLLLAQANRRTGHDAEALTNQRSAHLLFHRMGADPDIHARTLHRARAD